MLRPLLASVVVLSACAHPRPAPLPPPAPPPVAAPAPVRPPPVVAAARRPVVETYGSTVVTDDYEWLEDGESEETKAFVDAENALSTTYLAALPERAAVHERYRQLLSATSPDWTAMHAVGGHLFALNDAPPKQQKVLVDLGQVGALFGRVGAPIEHVVLDPNALDPSGQTTIDMFAPSPDAKIVALSLSKGGSESGDLHLVDTATGRDRSETIARVYGGTAGGSVAWNVDGTGFYYTRYPRTGERPEAELGFWQQVWFHKVGTAEAADTYAFGKELPKIAEVELHRSEDGKRILAKVANGDGGEVEHHLFDGSRWLRLSRFEDQLGAATLGADGKVYAVAHAGSPRGRVVVFEPPFTHASDLLPEGDGVIADLVVRKDALYAIETIDGPSRIRRFALGREAEPLAHEPPKAAVTKKGTTTRKTAPPAPPERLAPGSRGPAFAVLPLPPIASVAEVAEVGDDLLVRVESFTEAPRWLLYRAAEHRFLPTSWAKVAAFKMDDAEVTRASCKSKDGTEVPMTIVSKRGMTRDRSLPTLLTGYGGFGITLKPRMRASTRVWLDAGGVFAEANLRGGGERGEAWHQAGAMTRKQNVFDDFDACAKTLFGLGYTRPERLAITGRSNGGLLMGAALTQHPDHFRAVVSGVGIYDMLRNERSANGAFNVTEYGTVTDEALFRALYAYSPYHRVKDGVAYPAVLFITGANDPRVDPLQSRKMTARLQAATSSTHPILLRAIDGSGHGMGRPLAAEIEESSDQTAFLLHELGAAISR